MTALPTTPTVLISSAGRRVELLRSFRHTLATFNPATTADPVPESPGPGPVRGRVLATDCSWHASAFHDADEGFLVPRCSDPAFLPRMLALCGEQKVDLLVPTIDPELPVYAAARERFAEVGTTVAVSSPEVAAIAADKQRTHDWLTSQGFPTVRQGTPEQVLAAPGDWPFPLLLKPRFGSASVGVTTVRSEPELHHVLATTGQDREMVVQTVAAGREHTIDVLVTGRQPTLSGSAGEVAVAVPRRRIEVRAGEVAKAVTVRSPELAELAEKLCAALPGAYGPLNVQVFAGDGPGELAVIEINARFGGGFPLSFAAGSDMPRALLQDALGLPVTATLTGWRADLMMLRYDAAVFVDRTAPTPSPTGP